MALPALLTLSGCDEVDEADRLVYVKPAAAGRCILVEDYTGQRCVNCPTGNDQLHALQVQYGADTVVVVGFHSGPLAKSPRYVPYALWTQDGEDYYTRWKVENQPCIYVDRQVLNETTTAWVTLVREALLKPATLRLGITAAGYDPVSRETTLKVTALGTEGTTSGNVQLWLTESKIIDFQYMPDGSVKRDYEHNHVYRKAVNGLDGDPFSIGEAEEQTLEFTCTLDEGWVPENMHAVAFVYNNDGVQQVATCPLIYTEEPEQTSEDE